MASIPKTGKRVPFNFRAKPDLYEKVRSAAKKSGRSMSEEVELRLTMSMLEDEMVLMFGPSAGHVVRGFIK